MNETVKQYRDNGWATIRVEPNGKRPISHNRAEPEEFLSHENIGIVLGAASNGLVDVDLDDPLAREFAPTFLPMTATFSKMSHWIYYSHEAPAFRGSAVDLRAEGVQTVFPGSVKASGERITWDSEEPIRTVSRDRLRRCVLTLELVVWIRKASEANTQEIADILTSALILSGWAVGEIMPVLVEAVDKTPTRPCLNDPWGELAKLLPISGPKMRRLATDPVFG